MHGFEGTDDCKVATLEFLTNIYQPDSQKRRFLLSKKMRNKLIFKRMYYGLSNKISSWNAQGPGFNPPALCQHYKEQISI